MQWREQELLDVLRNETLKTGDIIDRVNMSKTTALKYLESLRAKGYIDCKMVGPTKLWSYTEAENEMRRETHIKRMPAELKRYIHIDKRVLEMLEEFEIDTGKELNILVDKTGMSLILGGD
jgi:predicted ArsR family transcriptional regulator